MKANRILPQLMLAIVALLFATIATATMYKWTDQEGNIHYTETPPDNGDVKEIAPPPRVATPTKPGKRTGENGRKKGESGDSDSADDRAEEELSPEKRAAYARNCEAAKANLNIYKTSPLVKEPDGKVLEMNDETRQQKIQQAEEQVKKFCK